MIQYFLLKYYSVAIIILKAVFYINKDWLLDNMKEEIVVAKIKYL